MKVSIVGVGPGTREYVLPLAKKKLEEADCLIGARRLVALFKGRNQEAVFSDGRLRRMAAYIQKYKNKKRLAVLVSGDPGIHSLLKNIEAILKPGEYEVIPGISTVQLAFARIGTSWQEAKILSLHGRNLAGRNLAREIRHEKSVFLLTDSSASPVLIARQLLEEGLDNRKVFVFENLSYPDEKMTELDLQRLSKSKNKFKKLCVLIIQRLPRPKGKLYGVGIGPGDASLMTLRARTILDRVSTIFVPKSSGDTESVARSIVESVIPSSKNFVELMFPMTQDPSILNRCWSRAADEIAKTIRQKKEVAFVTIGDPFIYSTYIYLLRMMRLKYPDIPVETVPGISAFNAAASALDVPLVEGAESFAVIPVVNRLDKLRYALEEFETVVLMKVGSKLKEVMAILRELGLLKYAGLVSRVGHADERIVKNLAALKDEKLGYLSVIIVKKPRKATEKKRDGHKK